MAGIEDLTPQQLKWLRYGEMVLEAKDAAIVDEAKRLARKVRPDLHLPEIDLEDKINAEKKAREDWEAEQEQKARDKDLAQRREAQAQRSRDAGFDPEEIEKIVIEEKCSFPTALRLASAMRDSAVPGPASFSSGLPLNRTQDGEINWRKLSPADARRKGQEIFRDGLTDLMRRQRGR